MSGYFAGPLGRCAPSDWRHVELYPYEAAAPATVERVLTLPGWRAGKYPHDQGTEGSCVGHAIALERAISNAAELHAAGGPRRTLRYDPISLWRAAKAIDEWPGTRPEDNSGTSVRAAYEVARVVGLRPVRAMRLEHGLPVAVDAGEPSSSAGVEVYRWARTVDEARAAIAAGVPVSIGVSWYSAFDVPIARGSDHWLPKPADGLARVRGGHSVCLYGASDRRQAFRLCNSWGRAYPLVWLPYETLELLLAQDGEAALVTDRAGA